MRTSMIDSVSKDGLPELIRVSIGSAIVLGLASGRLDAAPTTIYLLTYRKEKCTANCSFCAQARTSQSRADALSRVVWPVFPVDQVLTALGKTVASNAAKRVCIQALNYPEAFNEVLSLVKAVRSFANAPVSVSCQPFTINQLSRLKRENAERVGIPLDAASKHVFIGVKGSDIGGVYSWETQRQTLLEAVKIFGAGYVSTHLIAGLGETEKEMAETIQWCVDNGICPSLFAFTPVKGTRLEKMPPPPIGSYRRLQVARHLMVAGFTRHGEMGFDEQERIKCYGVSKSHLEKLFERGEPFLTAGCRDCNRPYYNEKPGGIIYNYPRLPTKAEIEEIKSQLAI